MQDAESHSLSSSQAICEAVDSLNLCIQNNGEGLQRALSDLQESSERDQRESNAQQQNGDLPRQGSVETGSAQGTGARVARASSPRASDITEMANKILFQFENFSEYSHAEVKKTLEQVQNRDIQCQNKLEELKDLFGQFQAAIDDFRTTSKNLQNIGAEVQMLQGSCGRISPSSLNGHAQGNNSLQDSQVES